MGTAFFNSFPLKCTRILEELSRKNWSSYNMHLYRTYAMFPLNGTIFYSASLEWFQFRFSTKHYICTIFRSEIGEYNLRSNKLQNDLQNHTQLSILELSGTGLILFRREGLQSLSETIFILNNGTEILIDSKVRMLP